ncbi:AAA family ATPase [Streptomyces sp. NPDC093252]|uniref:helix-turn-helix transcriptional regulator n=1 Tax=Streptomyces sp. NPDC093252 TaxID=3154980 RepID=UPI00342B508B
MNTPGSRTRRGSPSVGELVGRRTEIAEVLDVVAEGPGGPRLLLLVGEAGTGKSGLLAVAVDRARDTAMLVLTSQGSEAESRQSFASLHQLLFPLLPDLAGLPDHLRGALETAFGLAPAEGPHDPLRLCVAVQTLLARVARRQRVLLAIDDLQHFDRDSLDVLGFVLRRLTTDTVPTLVTARGQHAPHGFPANLPTLLLGPLADDAAAELVDAQPYVPTGRTRLELLRQARGNPLAIIELCRAAGNGGSVALPGGLLLHSARIEELYAARLRELPPTTQLLVLHAAASERDDLTMIMAAAGTGPDLEAWAPAERAGLVTIVEGRVVFRHPLARAGSYHGAPAHLRYRAHQQLAAAFTADPARRAWHLAAACLDRDESVAAALEETAGLAERRGGFFAAARALERSAECTPDVTDRARRYAGALHAAANAGDPTWVQELYEKVVALPQDRHALGSAACGAGLALSLLGRQRQAAQVLLSALEPEPPEDGKLTVALTSVLQGVAFQSGLPEVRHAIAGPVAHLANLPQTQHPDTAASEHPSRLPGTQHPHTAPSEHLSALPGTQHPAAPPSEHPSRLPGTQHPAEHVPAPPQPHPPLATPDTPPGAPPTPDERATHYAELATAEALAAVRAVALAGSDPAAAPDLLPPLRRGPRGPRPAADVAEMTRVHALGGVAWFADESDLSVESFRQAYALLKSYGYIGAAATTFAVLGSALIDTGRWAEADEHLRETATLAAVHKLKHLQIDVEALRATLGALRGNPVELPSDPAWTAVGLDENRATHARLLHAAGTVASAAGDFDSAFRHFRQLFDADGGPLHYFLSPRSITDLAAAAQRTDRREEGARVLASVRAAAGPRPTTRMTLLLHHAAALTGDPKDTEHHFRLATVNPAGDQWPLVRAQARLRYAQWLRRRRRPLDARPLLAAAEEAFTRLGASGPAGEALAELRASGVGTVPAGADALAELTAQQRQIVRLAAQGLRNREIAEQLLLSPRTVSSHLYQVYPKLGVSSRTQLRALLDDL